MSSFLEEENESLLINDALIEGSSIFPVLEKEEPKEEWKLYRSIYFFTFVCLYFWGNAFIFTMTTLRLIELYEMDGNTTEEAEANAVVLAGWLSGIQYIITFFTGPIYGKLADKYGRKPFFAISMMSTALNASAYVVGRPIYWLFICRTISAFGDSFWTIGMLSTADLTPPRQRAFGFGIFWACIGSSLVGFPLLAGLLADHYGIVSSFKVGILLIVVCMFLLMGLPETKRELSTKHLTWRDFNPFSSFGLLAHNSTVIFLTGLSIIMALGVEGIMDIFTTWVKYSFPDLTNFQLGSLSGVLGLGMLLGGILVRFLVPRFGDHLSIIIASFLGGLAILAFTFVKQYWVLYPLLLIRSVNVISSPVIQSLVFKEVPVELQAPLVGVLVSAKHIPSMFGPFLFPPLFSYFITPPHPHIPGIVFYIVAFLNVFSAILAFVFFWKTRWSKQGKIRRATTLSKNVVEVSIQ